LADKYDYDLVSVIKAIAATRDEKGKALIKESRMETIRKKCAPYREIYNQNKTSESFANWYYEKMLLGYTYGKTLRDIFLSKKEDLIYLNEIKQLPTNKRVSFIGVIEDKPYKGVSKAKGNKYLRIKINDETSNIEAMIFNDKMEYCNQMNGGDPKEGDIVIIKGIKKDDKVFADLIAIQNNKVYTKLSDLKKTEEIA
jgi:DNA polymerase III alpha subunit